MKPAFDRATLLVNTSARGVPRGFEGASVVRYLAHRGVECRLAVPWSPEETVAAARASADRGDQALFVVGGDGTLRLAAQGLAGSPTALAAVPAGTVNVWAKEAGIPGRPRAAIDAHLSGQVVSIDVGRCNGEAFLLMAGVGWDGAIAAAVSPRLKRPLGPLAYALQAARMLPRLRTVPARWSADGRTTEGRLALLVAGNTRLYGGFLRFTPQGSARDGLLDVCALCPGGVLDTGRLAAALVLGRLHRDPVARYERVRELVIETPGIRIQLDGDAAGQTPATITIEPGALRVSLPAGELPAVVAAG